MRRTGILFSDFGPYHVARIEALGEVLATAGVELLAFRFTERSDDYGWNPAAPVNVSTITLAREKPVGILAAMEVAAAFGRELRMRKVDAVFLPTYSPLPNLLCFLAAKCAGCRTILMTESWHGTEGASLPGKFIKHVVVRMFNSALVGGTPQTDYVVAYGMPREKVFTGYDVVDNDSFASRAERAREMAKKGFQCSVGSFQVGEDQASKATELPIKGLPKRYFLNLGRFVEKKNLSTLVAAYARYAQGVAVAGKKLKVKGNDVEERGAGSGEKGERMHGVQGVGHGAGLTENCKLNTENCASALVLVGEGALRGDLERQARELGLAVRDGMKDPVASGGAEVVFYPFQQADMTPLFFALCEAFVLPSKREEWGLVVNEAMACGAPVLVSNRVGAHFDLVEEGVTGFSFDPDNSSALAELLGRFDSDPTLRDRLGSAAKHSIEQWKPSRFGQGGLQALRAAGVLPAV